MNIAKVKAPNNYRSGLGGSKDRFYYNDSYKRFDQRFERRYGGEIRERSRYQGFKGYDLGLHDLVGIRSYERTGEIDRIVRERSGEPYLIGIELEIERVRDRGAVGEILKRYLPDRHICVRDGSIASDGIEIVTSPIAPREIGRIPWYNLLRSLSRIGCTSHDSGACGLHISISRGYLTDRTWGAIRSMLFKDRALFETLSRRLIGKGNQGDPFGFCGFTPRDSKYQALNLTKGPVCEFRFFRGTLSVGSFIASIEIIRSIVEYAKDRERGSGDRAPRLNARSWIDWIQDRGSFGVARDYLKDRATLILDAPRAPRRAGDRVARFIRERSRSNTITINDSGDLIVDGSCGDRLMRSLVVGSCVQGDQSVEYQIPIVWDRCDYLPQYVRDLVARGTAPREIRIRSTWGPDIVGGSLDRRGISFSFYRGGWGSRSQLYIHAITAQG